MNPVLRAYVQTKARRLVESIRREMRPVHGAAVDEIRIDDTADGVVIRVGVSAEKPTKRRRKSTGDDE